MSRKKTTEGEPIRLVNQDYNKIQQIKENIEALLKFSQDILKDMKGEQHFRAKSYNLLQQTCYFH